MCHRAPFAVWYLDGPAGRRAWHPAPGRQRGAGQRRQGPVTANVVPGV